MGPWELQVVDLLSSSSSTDSPSSEPKRPTYSPPTASRLTTLDISAESVDVVKTESETRDEKKMETGIFGGPFESMIVVLVGSESVPFYVHKEILNAGTGFFKQAPDIPSTAPLGLHMQSGVLSSIEPATFRLFIHWLYNNSLLPPSPIDDNDESSSISFELLFKLYDLGQLLGAFVFKNAVVAYLIDKYLRNSMDVPSGLSDIVYSRSGPGSPLRKLWVAFHALSSESWSEDDENQNLDFMKDLLVKQKEMMREGVRTGRAEELDVNGFFEPKPGTGRCLERDWFPTKGKREVDGGISEELEMDVEFDNSESSLVKASSKKKGGKLQKPKKGGSNAAPKRVTRTSARVKAHKDLLDCAESE